jgi:hypothetical protein
MGKRLRPTLLVCGVLHALALVLLAPEVRADETSPNVEELKKRGNQAMMELNYAQALEAYRAAIAIAPDDAVLYYNLGRALQAREEYPAALDALETFAKKAPPELRARVPKLEELVQDVRVRIGAIDLSCNVDAPQAVVTIGPRTTITGCAPAPKTIRFSLPQRRGALDVRFSDDRLQAQASRVDIVGGSPPVAVALALLPKASSGRLVVKATPSSASVSIDGLFKGNPPVEVPLAPGPHTVDVTADRHESAHVPVVIDVGATREVELPLEKSAPITTKWWFWAGVTVAAVGTGVLIWYLVEQPERDATTGTIDPGQVPATFRF